LVFAREYRFGYVLLTFAFPDGQRKYGIEVLGPYDECLQMLKVTRVVTTCRARMTYFRGHLAST
jgi:hypothetical protein